MPQEKHITKSGKVSHSKTTNPYKDTYQGRYRCTQEEQKIISAMAQQAGLNVGEYVRRKALGNPVYSAGELRLVGLLQAIHRDLWGWRHEQGITLDYPTHSVMTGAARKLREALKELLKKDWKEEPIAEAEPK